MSQTVQKSNADRLKTFIGFLRYDSQEPKTIADGFSNVERAAADFIENNFALVQGMADAYHERGAEK